MKHDQFWKTILRTFLQEFMELFFPEIAGHLDFSKINDVNRQMFTDLPQGAMREPDIALEVRSLDDETEIILIHIEIERNANRDIPRRMWEYYSLLRLRTKRKVLPLVLYLRKGAGGISQETYAESVLGLEALLFRYMTVGLGDLSAEEYLERGNALAAPLSALMQGDSAKRVSRKIRAFEKLRTAKMDEARKSLLIYMIDSYLPLSKTEEAEMSSRLKNREGEEVHEWLSSYEIRGIKKGRREGKEEGKNEGLIQGKKETLLLLLNHHFESVPSELLKRIEAIDNANELDALALKVMDAANLEDLGFNGQ